MSDAQSQGSQNQGDQSLADLGIEGGGSQPNAQPPAYTLEDFLPVLLTLLTPRKALTTVPTFTPKTFADCIQLYTDGTNFFLYVFMNGTWHTFPASPVSQIIAGDSAIGISPSSGTGAVSIFNLGVKSVLPGTNISVASDGAGHYTVNATAPAAALYASGLVTQAGNDNTDIVVLHGLGVKPKLLKVTATYGGSTPAYGWSSGTFDGTNYAEIMMWGVVTSGGAAGSATDRIIHITQGSAGTFACTASMDSTQFTLSPTVAGSPGLTGDVNILWEAYA